MKQEKTFILLTKQPSLKTNIQSLLQCTAQKEVYIGYLSQIQ